MLRRGMREPRACASTRRKPSLHSIWSMGKLATSSPPMDTVTVSPSAFADGGINGRSVAAVPWGVARTIAWKTDRRVVVLSIHRRSLPLTKAPAAERLSGLNNRSRLRTLPPSAKSERAMDEYANLNTMHDLRIARRRLCGEIQAVMSQSRQLIAESRKLVEPQAHSEREPIPPSRRNDGAVAEP